MPLEPEGLFVGSFDGLAALVRGSGSLLLLSPGSRNKTLRTALDGRDRESINMDHYDRNTTACIEECLRCYRSCFGMVMTHCLEMGGKHTEPKHFRLMMACAEICRTAAHFMLMKSEHAKHLCHECAEICEECATDCEKLGDMKDCVDACRRCAVACRKMAA